MLFVPAIRALKDDHPDLQVLVHTGLVDATRAWALKQAGVDVAMLDIIGDEDTIRDVYHLDRPVADFEDLPGWAIQRIRGLSWG